MSIVGFLHENSYKQIILDFFLLSAIGFHHAEPIVAYGWFIFPLFWLSLFYYCLFKNFNNPAIFITGIIIYISYVLLGLQNEIVASMSNMFRGIGGLGLG
jgi:hypothetical protein